ncbi:HAD-IIB family hydrolase [Phycisphaera mikurensis]|uniref:Putative sucrose-phosphate phosphatase n=1 Tax=Phycisphaera mikurensis (strain NBRC 102666 / KCTC 22515 / FYK2301M01) TaxID=1142394 RepID=I0IC73_PHYMF|nr:HAD-IIB family hydrolase [Phycisphaera mikurensis]MBB6441920.1 mannosylfructose-6-phosphate phosphatase [Phycisphaera mikurensis]BAM02861.1 putative sucrose-phosphate phosphatase [Phycisphaera mikurensis NBRC 102666]
MPDAPPYILLSDVDDTLLGDDAATRRFADFVESRRDRLAFVMNSSRFVASQLRSLEETALPGPDLLIGGMGTEIALPPGGSRLPDAQAHADIWRAKHLAGWDVVKVVGVLDRFPGVEPQPEANQSDLKQSRYLRDASEEDLAALRGELADVGQDVRVTYSSARDLDVTPAGADKSTAVRFVMKSFGYDDGHAAVAGDSGNDRAMLTCGAWGIVVANHRPELADLAGERIHRAAAGHADGVIEGLKRWFPELA